MSNYTKIPESARAYFDTLPKSVQEQILQSGVTVSSKEDLETIYRNITSGKFSTSTSNEFATTKSSSSSSSGYGNK